MQNPVQESDLKQPLKGIVIGGGIGGLAVAIGLQKQGFEVTIHEAAPTVKPVGAGLWVAPNGLEALRRIEPALCEEVSAAGWHFDRLRIAHRDGQVFSSIDARQLGEKFGLQPCAILRAALHECLGRHLAPGTLFTGDRFVSYAETEAGVSVEFESGKSLSADFLIGADGIRSRVREQLFGPQPLRYSGQTCWRGISPFALPEAYRRVATELWCDVPGLRAGFSQVSPDQTYFYLTDAVEAGGKDELDTLQAALLARFDGFPTVVRDLISMTDPAQLLHNDLYDLEPLSHYSRGRIALLGDSAHATTPNLGQGANQALESALAVTRALGAVRSASEIPAAFAAYERKRHAKATYVVNTSQRIGELSNIKSRFGQKVRNFVMSHVPAAMTERTFEKIYTLVE